MHRRRKHRSHATHHRRRRSHRRVGAALGLKGKDSGLKLLALAGGFLLGDSINTEIDKKNKTTSSTGVVSTKIDPNVISVAEIGIGGLLLLKKKSAGMVGTLLQVGGGILAGAGIRRVISQLGIMNGYQAVPVIGRPRMAGYQSVPVIGNKVIPPQLAGKMPPQLTGFRVNGYTPTGSGVMGAIGATDIGSGITNTSGGGYMG